MLCPVVRKTEDPFDELSEAEHCLARPTDPSMNRIFLACCPIVFAFSWALAQDAKDQAQSLTITAPAAMQGPRFTLQVMGGYYKSTELGPGQPLGSTVDPTFNYAPIDVRIGYLLSSPSDSNSLFRGAGEILFDVMVAPVTDGYTDIVVGPSILLRYNFVRPNAFLVPYIQGGGGLVYSDAYQTKGQSSIGEAVEFLLQAQGGVRWILNDKMSVDFEFGIQHISNAGLNDRNGGLNTLGGGVGVTYYFPEYNLFRRR